MFSKLKSVVFSRIQENNRPIQETDQPSSHLLVALLKFPYGRPAFLQCEEVLVSADHEVRPIIVPRDITSLPWNTGYAESINAGKSQWNEDQCSINRGILIRSETRDCIRIASDIPLRGYDSVRQEQNAALTLPYTYFGTFDGHAGVGASLAAANQLHDILHQKLVDVLDHLIPPLDGVPLPQMEARSKRGIALWITDKEVPLEPIIMGALEAAFHEMDQLIAQDRIKYKMKGGCTALVALFILGKLFVANAGDSRAVVVHNGTATPMSHDHTPESERPRIRKLAALKPELLGEEFTHLDFFRRPFVKDLGKRILYRDAYMVGWAYKTVTPSDLKHPVVWGEGKRSRVMATIGVTRGFGDHDLTAANSNLLIKPFLSSQPEIRIIDLSNLTLSDDDVLLMATDGLWDVIASERAADIVTKSLKQFSSSDPTQQKHRYTSAAQYLVMNARGKRVEATKNWRLSDGTPATIDDISVFVIPLAPYKEEYMAWKQDHDSIRGLYDAAGAENTRYGQLSLMASPVGSRRHFDTYEKESPLGTVPKVDQEREVREKGILDLNLKASGWKQSSLVKLQAASKPVDQEGKMESFFDDKDTTISECESVEVLDNTDSENGQQSLTLEAFEWGQSPEVTDLLPDPADELCGALETAAIALSGIGVISGEEAEVSPSDYCSLTSLLAEDYLEVQETPIPSTSDGKKKKRHEIGSRTDSNSSDSCVPQFNATGLEPHLVESESIWTSEDQALPELDSSSEFLNFALSNTWKQEKSLDENIPIVPESGFDHSHQGFAVSNASENSEGLEEQPVAPILDNSVSVIFTREGKLRASGDHVASDSSEYQSMSNDSLHGVVFPLMYGESLSDFNSMQALQGESVDLLSMTSESNSATTSPSEVSEISSLYIGPMSRDSISVMGFESRESRGDSLMAVSSFESNLTEDNYFASEESCCAESQDSGTVSDEAIFGVHPSNENVQPIEEPMDKADDDK